jgi:hypothetical protein
MEVIILQIWREELIGVSYSNKNPALSTAKESFEVERAG